VINMGGEMLYILEQRLRAQSIPEEKSLRVLRDVISTMFSEKFIGELFKPQQMYSNASTRQIFDRLAHSSIMRLNESSMDKLYDMMTMGFKYQVLSCSHPSDLLQITLNHLDALRALVKQSVDATKLVDNAQKIFVEQYKDLNTGQLMALRQALCRFFQERKVKVSLFLQDQIQSLDGAIIISHEGPLPIGTQLPGTIRYFGDDGKVVSEDKIKLKNATDAVTPAPTESFDVHKPQRPCKLGLNLYAKDRKKSKLPAGAVKKHGYKSAGGGGATAATAIGNDKKAFEASHASKAAATKQLNMLANLIGTATVTPKDSEKLAVINLFPDTSLTGDGKSGGPAAQRTTEIITFDENDSAQLKALLRKELEDSSTGAASAGGDDLLSLMDKASS